ncbi:MAG: cyanophycinase [Bacteriovoracaceae bacterium]|nr:cyanophycinase [Bacteriovoracaceae bacterium]
MKKFIALLLIPVNVWALGNLYIVGGGKQPDALMQKFLGLCGKENKILVIAKASSYEAEVREEVKNWMLSLGAKNVVPYVCEESQSDCQTNFKNVRCIYFSGGDQNKLTKHFYGKGFVKLIRKIHIGGGTIGGTSAGAAIQSEIMLTGDILDSAPKFNRIAKDHVETTRGFGFLSDFVIDQHFIKRGRQNRLLSTVLENPNLVGLGIDESTAAIFKGSLSEFTVEGKGSVMVYDARSTDTLGTDTRSNFNVQNLKMNILTEGMGFSL